MHTTGASRGGTGALFARVDRLVEMPTATPTGTATPAPGCALYPIALHVQSLEGLGVGDVIPDIYNGTQPGNFGWLTWTGDPSTRALVTSLTPPGDSDTYVNPANPDDHLVSVGDEVPGKPGVSNSSAVRAALTALKLVDITVPVWDAAAGRGSNSSYRIAAFAQVRLLDFQLAGQNRISARFLGYRDCGAVSPRPTTTATNTPAPAPTATPSPIPSQTPTRTPTVTATNTPVPTPTDTSTLTQTPTNAPTVTLTGTPTATSTQTPTNTRTATPTNTPSPTPTDTPIPTQTGTNTPTATPTRTPTSTPTTSPTNSPVRTPTDTPIPTQTSTNTPTATLTETATAIATYTPTGTPTATLTNTPVPTATGTPTEIPTETPAPTPTATPTSAPLLLSVNPIAGQQGQQNLSVNLTGQYTHWEQGTSVASFGAGITVVSLTIDSPTTGTAVVNIDSAASVGFRNVGVTTGPETATKHDAFIVSPATPVLLSITPDVGIPGQTGIPATGRRVLVLTPDGRPANRLTSQLGAVGFTTALGSLAPGQIAAGLTPDTCCVYIWSDGSVWNTGTPEDPSLAFNDADRGALVAFSQSHRSFIMDGLAWRDYWGADNSDAAALSQNEAIQLFKAGGGIVLGADDVSGPRIVQHVNQVLSWFGFNLFIGVYSTVPRIQQCIGGSLCTLPHTVDATQISTTTTYSDVPHGLQANGIFVDTALFGSPSDQTGWVPSPPDSDTFNGVTYPQVDHLVTTSIGGGGTNSHPAISVVITGQYTHFTDFSAVDLGPGITVGKIVAVDATHLTAEIGIAADAPAGVRPLTVTTGTEVVTLANAFTVAGAPALISITPNEAEQENNNVQVAIVGQNTHFTNASKIDLWTGVTASSIVATDATHLTALLNIAPGAPTGAHNLTVTTDLGTDIEVVRLNGALTVKPGPVLVSMNPNSVYPGAAIPVNIVGQKTHFTNASTINLGAGVTASSIIATDATHVTAVLNIPANYYTAYGAHDLMVSTDLGTSMEVVTLLGALTINPPILDSVNPNNGQQGQANIPVSITSKGTFWQSQPPSVIFAGTGITTGPVTVTSDTSLTLPVTIDPGAAVGARNVVVQTSFQIAGLTNGFTVTAGTPAIAQVNPNTGQQGQANLNVTITGLYTNFAHGVTTVSFGDGITPGSVTVSSKTSFTVPVTIDAAAVPGGRTVTVTTGSEVVSLANGFTVPAGTPAITQVSPNTGQQGQTNLSITITGQYTNFTPGVTTVSFGVGITTGAVSVASKTSLSVPVSIDPAAALGGRPVTVATGAEVVSLANGFTVASGAPVITQVNPTTGRQGQANLTLYVYGKYTNFVQGATTVDFGVGITPGPVTVVSKTYLYVPVSIDAVAAPGARTVTATTGAEAAALVNGFTVTASAPVITQISPNTGELGRTNLNITITGQFTNFAQGITTVSFGAGITTGAVTVASKTSLTVPINISPATTAGVRYVSVTTGSEVVGYFNIFTVTAGPFASQVNPGSALQGAQGLNIAITGQNTHFVQGTTLVSFGPGVTVNAVTIGSATSLAAQISISAGAAVGPRDITVTTAAEQVVAASAFMVVGAPAISQVNPGAGQQNQSLDVAITGQYTNFVQGNSQVSFGAGIGVGTVTVSGVTSLMAHITIDAAAALGLRTVTVTTGTETATLPNGFGVTAPAAAPTVSLATPEDASTVTSMTNVVGTVSSPVLQSWILEYATQWNPNFTTIATGNAAVSNGVLGSFDPTLLANGNARVRLSATDLNGNSSSTSISIVIAGNQKVGNFSVSFRDLSVPLPGISLDVIRTYDTRKLFPDSFGVGWSLSFDSITVNENRVVGKSWIQTSYGGFFPTYCLQEAKPHIVTVTMADNTIYRFQPVASPQCQQFYPIDSGTVLFRALPGTTATLEPLGGADFMISNGGAVGPLDLWNFSLSVLNIQDFLLTTKDGTQYVLSVSGGLSSITDPNGNTITITPDGIFHSSGKSIFFQRDSAGRIIQIVDPRGHTTEYAYDLNNNLTSFTDRENTTTTFSYNSTHGLVRIDDPRGVTPLRNIYDDSGRLIQQVDGSGKVVNFTHDLNTRQEVITDRLGRVKVYEYDADGNIVRETDALGNVIHRTYDANDNVLSETNALGQTTSYTYDDRGNRLTETDPLNHTTTNTYDTNNRLLTRTDPLGHVTTNIYDANGNVLSTTDAANNTTTYTVNAQGLRLSKTDPLGNTTTYQYDANGFLTREINPLGVATTYTYDADGNKTSESVTRTTPAGPETLVTQYQHDRNARLTKAIFPDGSNTQNVYDGVGNLIAKIDPRGLQTAFTYDAQNRLLTTRYPDGTGESNTYDAEGQKISSTDPAGHTTTYQYDAGGRLVKTTYPDGASMSMAYDQSGRLISQTDALGHVTTSAYDAAGRLVQVTDALNHTTTYTYDAAGNRRTMTDAAGHTTSYQFDAMNRLVRTTYPDSTYDAAAYDALGGITARTDQAGATTQFQYDAAGRLIEVIDALNQVTQYAYDEAGNRISATDADGHTTLYGFDRMGRVIKRTLPRGQFETFTYDAAGNRLSHVDFNGKTTTYTYYSNMNRLWKKTPDPSFSAPTVSFGYDATGQRAYMADELGYTYYYYDTRGRLNRKATTFGELTYAYTLTGKLASIRSSNVNGVSVNYSYDAQDRLATVTDNVSGTTSTIAYDAVGNLSSVAYPNGLSTAYTYSSLNRLTNETVRKGTTTVASYTYTFGPAGNRTAVSELGGRSVAYAYDPVYRLTSETVTGDAGGNNGAVTYTYDAVGNRLTRTSTVAGVPSVSSTYDANDRLIADTYDTNGNTVASGGSTYAYDFEDHLNTASGGVSYKYDGDGRRVQATSASGTVNYLIDDRNPTGLPQVMEEISGTAVTKVYTYGLSRISQRQVGVGTSYYVYDGHGSVRMLADTAGNVTDTYTYDAFGIEIASTGSTANDFRFSGEQLDPNIGFYYMRARYLNQNSGRFLTLDRYPGDVADPPSLHRYLYAGNDPVNNIDPSGETTVNEQMTIVAISSVISYYTTYYATGGDWQTAALVALIVLSAGTAYVALTAIQAAKAAAAVNAARLGADAWLEELSNLAARNMNYLPVIDAIDIYFTTPGGVLMLRNIVHIIDAQYLQMVPRYPAIANAWLLAHTRIVTIWHVWRPSEWHPLP